MTEHQTTIGEIADIFDGPHATPKKIDTGPHFLSISSLINGRLELEKSAYLSEEDFIKWTKRVTPQEEDLLFSYETRLGQAALMPSGIKACLGRRMGLLRPKRSKVLPQYLLYAYLSPNFQQVILRNTITGATVDRIALSEMAGFPIRIPPLNEQKIVADLLQAIDTKIELNNKINAELEAMAKLIYDYWFVQFDFPDANGKPYKSSGGKMVYNEELKREIPDGWDVEDLCKVESNIKTGKTPSTKKAENFNGDIPFICIGDVRGNMHISKTEMSLSIAGANSQANKFIPEGAICVTCIASPGLVGFATENSQTNQQLNTVVCEKFENRYYLYFYLKDYFRFAKAKSGNTFANMNKGDFSGIKVIRPRIELLALFSQNLMPSIEKILVNSKETNKLIELRDWLLPMLMNGQVTIKET